jgi:hypothetical protein
MDENENASCTHFSVCLFLLNAIRLLGGFGVLYSKIFMVAQICLETTNGLKLGDSHDMSYVIFFLCFLIDKYWFYFSI